MSSSHKSSRSVRPPRLPAWRTVSISKIPTAPGLSYIFAQPELGSPLSPAISQLTLPQSTVETQEITNNTTTPSLRSRLSSISSTRGDQAGVERLDKSSGVSTADSQDPLLPITRPNPGAGLAVDTQHISDQRQSNPTSSVDEASASADQLPAKKETTPSSKPSGMAWFASLSRRKGHYNIPQTNLRQSISSEDIIKPFEAEAVALMPSDATAVVTDSQLHPPIPTASSPIPPQDATIAVSLSKTSASISPPRNHPKRPWFSSPRPDLPGPLPSTTNSIACSIDEEVPVLPMAGTSPTLPSPIIVASPASGIDSGAGIPSISSLNPSTSRFTLSIPLLGRPKKSLDNFIIAQSDFSTTTVTKKSSNPSDPQPQIIENPTSTSDNNRFERQNLSQDSGVSARKTETTVSSNNQTPPPPSSSSLWTYIGWTTSQNVPPPPAEANQKLTPEALDFNTGGDSNSTAKSNPAHQKTQPLSSATTIHAVLSSGPKAIHVSDKVRTPSTTPISSNLKDNQDEHPTDHAPADAKEDSEVQPVATVIDIGPVPSASIHSADINQDSGSAWYNPWRWYDSTSSVPPAPVVNSESVTKPVLEVHNTDGEAEPQLTQAEMVKEAALNRSDTRPQENNEGHKVEASKEVNPVEATISTNRLGWTAFFSSKSLITKTITGTSTSNTEVDENGMEVMDVDSEDERPKTEELSQRGRVEGNIKPIDTKASNNKTKTSNLAEPLTPKTPKSALSSHFPSSSPNESAVGPASKTQPPPPRITISDTLKRETTKPDANKNSHKPGKKSSSPSPSTRSANSTSAVPPAPLPNLILPSWADTFHTAPRNLVPPPDSTFSKTVKFVRGVLFAGDKSADGVDGILPETFRKRKGKGKERDFTGFGKDLPRAWDVVETQLDPDILRGCQRVFVIGIHGWFPGAVMRSVLGEPTGTSGKFVTMMVQALEEFQEEHKVRFEKITSVPLEGEGTIDGRVSKLYGNLLSNREWMDDLHAADAILVATHSQGSIVSTHLLDCLIRDQHIKTTRNTAADASQLPASSVIRTNHKVQRVCCLALCGIHLGPLRYLSSSSLLQPYFQYFESAAARELFEFQDTESEVSKNYVKALRHILEHGTKMVYVASLNDQVVPIYSGLFTAASHPLILRALYIDGDAYHSSDFLSNLLVLLLRIFNSGLSDSGLTVHLSEATAGSLSGVGHSTAYEEISTYSLAVNYLFLTNNGSGDPSELILEPFDASKEQNDYEIPWSLRDVIADERVEHFFSQDIAKLRDAFRDWHPKTSILRDLKRKLQPIQRLPSSSTKL